MSEVFSGRIARAAVVPALLVLLGAVGIVAVTIGAAGIPFGRFLAAIGLADGDPAWLARDQLILASVRAPRIAMGILVGGLLAFSGTVMQGLFRNPLADPGLVGVAAGGALAAAAAIVLGDRIAAAYGVTFRPEALAFAAFVGALATTLILYRIATRERVTSIAIFLLAGLAIAALAMAGIGMLIFTADDRQLRDIQFWMLGSLGGATWSKVLTLLPITAAVLASTPFVARGLDFLVLGEAEAFHMGIAVQRLKSVAIVLVSAATGAAVAYCGVIGFVGIVVPHLLRLMIGPSHGLLLPSTFLFGGTLLVVADTFARTIVAPAELPIGILMALLGAPFFLVLLLRRGQTIDL